MRGKCLLFWNQYFYFDFLVMIVVAAAIYWFSYEWLKARRLEESGNTALAFSETFVAGALSGAVSVR